MRQEMPGTWMAGKLTIADDNDDGCWLLRLTLFMMKE